MKINGAKSFGDVGTIEKVLGLDKLDKEEVTFIVPTIQYTKDVPIEHSLGKTPKFVLIATEPMYLPKTNWDGYYHFLLYGVMDVFHDVTSNPNKVVALAYDHYYDGTPYGNSHEPKAYNLTENKVVFDMYNKERYIPGQKYTAYIYA